MSSFGTFTLCIIMGFATSQAIASLTGFVLGQTGVLRLSPRTDLQRLLALSLVTITGPAVLFENSLKAKANAEQSVGALSLALLIVLLWSFLIGVLVVRVAQLGGVFVNPLS